jgi:hypothetical protein
VVVQHLNREFFLYHFVRRALPILSRAGGGIEVADAIFRIAEEGDSYFEIFMKWARKVQEAEPNSGVLPTLREAYILRLFRAAQIADTDEEAPQAIEEAIGKLKWELV